MAYGSTPYASQPYGANAIQARVQILFDSITLGDAVNKQIEISLQEDSITLPDAVLTNIDYSTPGIVRVLVDKPRQLI